jgi:hypothetical protein
MIHTHISIIERLAFDLLACTCFHEECWHPHQAPAGFDAFTTLSLISYDRYIIKEGDILYHLWVHQQAGHKSRYIILIHFSRSMCLSCSIEKYLVKS